MKKMMAVLAVTTLLVPMSSAYSQTIPPAPGERLFFARLSGPAIEGVVPGGKATSTAFQGTTSLIVGASSINLPDDSVLAVALDGTVVGSVAVRFGNTGELLGTSGRPLVVHSGSVITLSLAILGGGIQPLAPTIGTVIASGTFQSL